MLMVCFCGMPRVCMTDEDWTGEYPVTRWTALALFGVSLAATAEPYTYYGGAVDAQEKSAAIEQCEYRELVEERRCNRSLNKSRCISEVHAECVARFTQDRSAVTAEDDANAVDDE